MKTIAAFFRLVRWPNLLLIVLTQFLFEFCIYQKVYQISFSNLHNTKQFFFLVIAIVFIYAAGYIINDYFDLNIDQINKPKKVIVNVFINRRWVIFWHMFLSLLGLFITLSAAPFPQFWVISLANFFIILLLWFYSTNFKKRLLIGNLLVSLLMVWVILIIPLSKHPFNMLNDFLTDTNEIRLFRFSILYASFAFIISLIREVIKDMEDLEGDRKYGCHTMPIMWGINASKVFVAVWIIVLVATLTILQFYLLALGWWHCALFSLLLIIAPLVWIFQKLFKAKSVEDFHNLSQVLKWVMLTGISSMVFFRFYL